MQMYGGVEVQIHVFLTLELDSGEWLVWRPAAWTQGTNHGAHWIGGWVGPGACLDVAARRKIMLCRESSPGLPACSLFAILMSSPGSWTHTWNIFDIILWWWNQWRSPKLRVMARESFVTCFELFHINEIQIKLLLLYTLWLALQQ
jgi:hypothetical protein